MHMFRVGSKYFRKIQMESIINQVCDHDRLKKELVCALEKASGRLAIAIAGESKSTPANLREHYLETAYCMRRFIARLQKGKSNEVLQQKEWITALEALRHIPLKRGAGPLCNHIRNIVSTLDPVDP